MATSILSLFENPQDNFQAQQQAFQQNLSRATDPRSFIAAVGSNLGGQLGGLAQNMFGQPSNTQKAQRIMQAVGNIADPLGQAEEAYKLFQQEGMAREAQITLQRIGELRKERQAEEETLRARSFDKFMSSPETQLETPEDYYAASRAAFQAGDRQTGIAMRNAGKAAAEKIKQEEKNKKTIDRRLRGVQAQSPNLPAELAQSVAEDADLYKEWSKTIFDAKKEKNNVSYQDINGNTELLVTDSQGNLVNRVVLGKAPEKGTRVQVGLDMKGQGEYAKTVGTEVAKKDVALVTNVETAAKNLPKINQALDILKKGDPTTGIGAELILNVNRVRSQFLKDKKAGKSVTDTQLLDAFLGSDVFPMIDALGIGARGLDTPAEREFLRNVFTGTIQMDKDTLIKLTELRKNIAERAVKDYNDKLGSGYFTKYEEALGRKLDPVQLQTGGTTTSKGTNYKIIEE